MPMKLLEFDGFTFVPYQSDFFPLALWMAYAARRGDQGAHQALSIMSKLDEILTSDGTVYWSKVGNYADPQLEAER